MIRYRLRCADGHEFEAWFRSSGDYDLQEQKGLVACAACGSAKVEKALMAPSVRTSEQSAAASVPVPAPVASAPPQAPQPVAAHIPPQLLEIMRKVRDHVRANADYVGDRFADEARKIHHEEAEPRGIYGEATAEEVRALDEEGIEVHPLPVLPEDQN